MGCCQFCKFNSVIQDIDLILSEKLGESQGNPLNFLENKGEFKGKA